MIFIKELRILIVGIVLANPEGVGSSPTRDMLFHVAPWCLLVIVLLRFISIFLMKKADSIDTHKEEIMIKDKTIFLVKRTVNSMLIFASSACESLWTALISVSITVVLSAKTISV